MNKIPRYLNSFMSIKQKSSAAAMCLVCKESCSGFQPHSWSSNSTWL
uniref:Uncharacterized protein n=1 Tax=Acanthochromis polyacanthus TaxID=80966 RepID=A0A3Q1F1D5_9TELE